MKRPAHEDPPYLDTVWAFDLARTRVSLGGARLWTFRWMWSDLKTAAVRTWSFDFDFDDQNQERRWFFWQ
ncbi:hypothetical protein GWI33_017141 [Rhynchophorus ferrugineus]|uniref:Uncharacterized protein n=1 Tax=Rhynchophorus ferrugineus TaxID=354439 RepID=A0A834HYP8_RHYFE|nr:hypothetical protein GWI33_017141 [Rhynchophorus ferrugineus]